MNGTAWGLLAVAAAIALVDWEAVRRRPSSLEYVCKPAVMVALIGVALALDPADGGQRAWFVAALVLSLAGDVFLLPKPDLFVAGLASFLLAHVAFVAGFAQVTDPSAAGWVLVVLLLVPVAVVARTVLAAVARKAPELRAPVVAYIAVIGAMVAMAVLSGDAVAIAGAAMFATSDSILAINRFAHRRPWMPLAVMVTYHLAQGLLVLSLVP